MYLIDRANAAFVKKETGRQAETQKNTDTEEEGGETDRQTETERH